MRRTLLLLALLLAPAPVQAQQDTASLKEIRQRAAYALSRAENMGDEAEALAEHLRTLMEALSVHIGPATPVAAALAQNGLLYADDFEDVPVGQRVYGRGANGFRWTGGFPTIVVSDDHAFSGTKSLQFDYPGEPDPSEDATREQRFTLAPDAGQGYPELWIEMRVRVPDNWHHRDPGGSNNKLLALWGEHYGSDTAEEEGYAVFEYRRAGDARSYLACAAGSGPSRAFDQNMTIKGTAFSHALRSQWVRLRFHVKIGNPGIMSAWRGDEKVSEMPADWDMTATVHPYIRQGYLFGWSNSGFSEDTNYYLDDFKIWTADPGWTF